MALNVAIPLLALLLLWVATGSLLITFVGYLAVMAALQTIAGPFVGRLEVLLDMLSVSFSSLSIVMQACQDMQGTKRERDEATCIALPQVLGLQPASVLGALLLVLAGRAGLVHPKPTLAALSIAAAALITALGA